MDNKDNNLKLVEPALKYIKLGYLVFPLHTPINGLCSCGDIDCRSIGKHPRTPNGFKDASMDPTKIKDWWEKWPDANIGIATGKISNLIVVDFDFPKGGDDTLLKLESKNGHFPSTAAVKTGNGIHLYFVYNALLQKNRVNILPGLDIRSNGGYVVAPPSFHANGKQYQWFIR
jgi:bifunctional DNA primase/polymerase-like protein